LAVDTDSVSTKVISAIMGRRPRPARSATAKIFVSPLEHAVRIRTGETDRDAI